MIPLTEDLAKDWLREAGLPVPRGVVVADADAAQASCAALDGPVLLKALVPTGRRGKAGAIIAAQTGAQRRAAAAQLLGAQVNGHRTSALYVEERIAIGAEYYLGFVLQSAQPEILICLQGGVDIEEIMREQPEALVRAAIDPLAGLSLWNATELWLRAGLRGPVLPRVAALTCRLYEAFCKADALLLEINPLAVTVVDAAGAPGQVCIVGAMLGVDEHAMFRQPAWRDRSAALPEHPRERAVAIADRDLPGGSCQYVELDGDIGLLVGGGGAGLYQHDMVLEAGGRPANHCVTPPTTADTGKIKAVLNAIFDNPRCKGLLVGFNFAQMARTDIRVRALVEVLDERGLDTAGFPIVIRLFGAGEADARAMTRGRPNIHYLPRGASLRDAVDMIVRLTAGVRAGAEGMAA